MTVPTYESAILQVKAYRILQANVRNALKKYKINPTEWSIVGIIYQQKNGIRLSEIANMLDIDRPLITIIANNLEKKELIDRVDHPKDKRAKLLFLTSKAKLLLPVIEKELQVKLIKLLNGLTVEELNTYKKVLETIVANNTLK